MVLWWPVHVSRQETGLYLGLPFPPLLLLCSGAERFSSPVNFSVPVMLGLLASMQRGANTGCAHFFPSRGFPLPLSVPLRPPGNCPKENSKIVKMIFKKYGLNEKSGRVVWFSSAKKTGNGGARVAIFKPFKALAEGWFCELPGPFFRSVAGERQLLKCSKTSEYLSHV